MKSTGLHSHCAAWAALAFSEPRRANDVPIMSQSSSPHSRRPRLQLPQANLRRTHAQAEVRCTTNTTFCPITMIDANPKTLRVKPTVVDSINQPVGRSVTESPHRSPHRPNVSISKSFIPGTISCTTSAALAETVGGTCLQTAEAISCW